MSILADTRTRLQLQPLHIQRDAREQLHEVGRIDTGVFVTMPTAGVDLLEWIGEGLRLDEVTARFRARHGQDPDLADFIETLDELGFIASPDDEVADEPDAAKPPSGWRPIARLNTARLGWTRSRLAVVVWAVLSIVAWVGVPLWLILDPRSRPTASSAWLGGDVMLNFAVLSAFGWTLVVAHEFSHVLAIRALGQDGTLTVGRRLYFLVLQTNVAGVRALPRRQRNIAYLSGMTWDLLVFFVCLVVYAAYPLAILRDVEYVLAMGLLFQCAFFMRTDVYYLFTNWLRLGNLKQDMQHWLLNGANRLVGRRPWHDLSQLPQRELKIVRLYAVFCVVSFLVLTWAALVLYFPLLSKFMTQALDQLGDGPTQPAFWDAVALLTVTVSYFTLLVYMLGRDMIRRYSARAVRD